MFRDKGSDAGICAYFILIPKRLVGKDDERKFCQARRIPQDRLPPVEDIRRSMTEFQPSDLSAVLLGISIMDDNAVTKHFNR